MNQGLFSMIKTNSTELQLIQNKMMFLNGTYLSETNDLSFAEHIRFRRHEIKLQKFSTR